MSGTSQDERGVGDGAENERTSMAATSFIATTNEPKDTNVSVAKKKQNIRFCSAKNWTPNVQLMMALTEMGISRVAAKKALFYTGNSSAELATAWIFENPNADLDTPLEMEARSSSDEEDGSTFNDVYKMVFVVNSSLEMGIGKIGAQIAHAAIGMHQLLLQDEGKFGDSLIKWFEYGETKIVLKGDTTQHLIDLETKSLEFGLPSYLVQDAGKTQVPIGSTTVLCIFGRVDIVDKVTGSLRLL